MYDVRDVVEVRGWASMLVVVDGMEYVDGIVISGGYPMGRKLKELIGNGYAEVGVGVNMGSQQDFGKQKFGAWSSVKLTCDQSTDGVEEAHAEARELAITLTGELLDEVEVMANERYPV